MSQTHHITHLLNQWQRGDAGALNLLVSRIYTELKTAARIALSRESRGKALTPTELVHEVYLKLVDQDRAHFQNRIHFLSISAQIMRRVLIDDAKTKKRVKRGGRVHIQSLEDSDPDGPPSTTMDPESLDEALNALEELDKRQARIVELKYFAGLSIEEICDVLAISESTVHREWRSARVWLYRYLKKRA